MLMSLLRSLSVFLYRHPALIFGFQRRILMVVWKVLDLDSANWVIRRQNWLRGTPALQSTTLLPASQQSRLSPGLAERIQAAYVGSLERGEGEDGGIWGSLRDTHLKIVSEALRNPDPEALRSLASRLFRTSAVNGFSYGTTFDRWPHRWSYLPVMIELSVVNLGECLGVLRIENQEQGAIAAWREQLSPENLIAALEEQLGFRVEQPRVGDPRGVMFGGRFLTRETCSQIYTAYRVTKALTREGCNNRFNLVEIGGGYGGLAYWTRVILGSQIDRHAIVDLPEVSAIQALFLGQTLAPTLPGETPVRDRLQLVLDTALEEIAFIPDVVINQDSMPEMPQRIAEQYLDWIAQSGTKLFVSFNHEAQARNSPRETQGWVSRMAGKRPAFERQARELSWDRPGYVEEIYRVGRQERHGSLGF